MVVGVMRLIDHLPLETPTQIITAVTVGVLSRLHHLPLIRVKAEGVSFQC